MSFLNMPVLRSYLFISCVTKCQRLRRDPLFESSIVDCIKKKLKSTIRLSTELHRKA